MNIITKISKRFTQIKEFDKISIILILFISTILGSIGSYLYLEKKISNNAAPKLYNSVNNIPTNRTGLLLGTCKYLYNGKKNHYYMYRIRAAVRLFKAGKISHILVSGDNSTIYYNEPIMMQRDLISKGVPADRIHLDYAGFRTLDSVIRSKKIFGQSHITIISQKFHNERALFIARNNGINAIAFNAQDVNYQYGLRTKIRERLARVKMILDIFFKKEPKFLGEKVPIV